MAEGLFRMGEATAGAGEWERWGWALVVAALVHVGGFWGLSATGARLKAPPPPEEPEPVLLTFMAPRAAAPRAVSAPPASPERVQRRARPPIQRPVVVPPLPEPVPEKAPVPEEAVQDTQAEAPAEEETASAGAVAGVVAGLVGSAMTTTGGVGLGATGAEAVGLKEVARPPEVLEQVHPRYPSQARSRGIEGLVVVRIIIGTDGRVEPQHTRVVRSVSALDAAAVSAVSQWRFSPAIGRQGRPVRVIIEVPVQFSLK